MDMAPETSVGEQGKEVEMVPAPATAHQVSQEELAAAKIEEVLSALRARISQLLGPASSHRVVSGDARRRCLAFIETDLSINAAFLTSLSPQHLDLDTMIWLRYYLSPFVPSLADHVLREVDPSRHTLLRRATQCFHRRNRKSYPLLDYMVRLYYVSEHPCRYIHLLVTSSKLGLTPQLAEAEACVLPLVGIDRVATKILRWLSHQGTVESSQLRVMSIVGPMGIGKTTLAVELRNRLRHETSGGCYYFQCNVMAQASRGTDRNILLLQDILSQVSEAAATTYSSNPSSSQAKTTEVLVRLVSECLRDKRYVPMTTKLTSLPMA